MDEGRFSFDEFRRNLTAEMAKKGVKPTTLSLMVGKNRTLIKDVLEKNSDVGIETVNKIAKGLGVPASTLTGVPRVAITGKAGAGGEVVFEEDNGDEYVIRPPGVSGPMEAIVVQGTSMFPRYRDGDVLYIQRRHDGVLPEYIGEDCVVFLASGETYVKQLMSGSEPGKFTLISLNAPPMEDVEVEWATPICFSMPARSRHLFS